jgi:ribose transport system permease protein
MTMTSIENRRFIERLFAKGGVVIALLLIVTVSTALAEPRFLNRLNLMNVLRNFAFLAIPALGQMTVMIAGGFDLSVGAVMAMASVITAVTMSELPNIGFLSAILPVLAALGCGFGVGLANGAFVVRFGLSSFMVTFASTSVIGGTLLYFTQGIPIYGITHEFTQMIGRGSFIGLPIAFFTALVLVAIAAVVQRLTSFGRHLYAVGSQPQAARLSGVRTAAIQLSAYAVSGTLAALTGVMTAALVGSGQSSIGASLGMQTIAAAVIGGVSLRGGSGRAEEVALASLLLTIIANGMNLTRIDSKLQTLVLGVVLIAALAVERLAQRRRAFA